jgi:hypothetical protein
MRVLCVTQETNCVMREVETRSEKNTHIKRPRGLKRGSWPLSTGIVGSNPIRDIRTSLCVVLSCVGGSIATGRSPPPPPTKESYQISNRGFERLGSLQQDNAS